MTQPRRRVFAGHQVKRLRLRIGIGQAEMARRLGISISYLSQIENDDRPITTPVLVTLAQTFPLDWADVDPDEETALLVSALEAGADSTVPQSALPEDAVRRGVKQQPMLARRMVALYAAYRRSQEQLRVLDDKIDSGAMGESGRLPWEEIRDWFHEAGNYIDPIDRLAEELAEEIGSVDAPRAVIIERLRSRHGVRIQSNRGGPAAELRAFDPARRLLEIDSALPPESALFLLAYQLMRLEIDATIQGVVADARLRFDASRKLLLVGLANYAAGALLMPYARFRQAARETRHDIDHLRHRFGVSFEQACHRLSTLQRPGLQGAPFFFCRVDMAGNITKRHSATRLQFARFGGACPLWIVHEAVAIPDRILVQLAETPDGTRYVSIAKGLVKQTGSYLRPARRYAVALGCEIEHASDFIYADGIALNGPHSATPIGTSCRICPRTACDQRAFPPAGRVLEVDPDRRSIVPYAFQ